MHWLRSEAVRCVFLRGGQCPSINGRERSTARAHHADSSIIRNSGELSSLAKLSPRLEGLLPCRSVSRVQLPRTLEGRPGGLSFQRRCSRCCTWRFQMIFAPCALFESRCIIGTHVDLSFAVAIGRCCRPLRLVLPPGSHPPGEAPVRFRPQVASERRHRERRPRVVETAVPAPR